MGTLRFHRCRCRCRNRKTRIRSRLRIRSRSRSRLRLRLRLRQRQPFRCRFTDNDLIRRRGCSSPSTGSCSPTCSVNSCAPLHRPWPKPNSPRTHPTFEPGGLPAPPVPLAPPPPKRHLYCWAHRSSGFRAHPPSHFLLTCQSRTGPDRSIPLRPFVRKMDAHRPVSHPRKPPLLRNHCSLTSV